MAANKSASTIDHVNPASHGIIGLLLSGGLDSSILLGELLMSGRRVQPFYVRCDLAWETAELAAARRFLAALQRPELAPLVTFVLPLTDVYGDHWSLTGRGVPDAATPDEAVYLPGRNPLLLVKAAVWCRLHGIDELALAPLGNNPFADASDEFFKSFESTMNRALGGSLKILRPFDKLNKSQVIRRGAGLPLQHTFSCICPDGDLHCGRCNKCAERQRAFADAELPDPTRYATRGSAA